MLKLKNNIVQLSWLRGMAIIFVLFSHILRVIEIDNATGEKLDIFPLLKCLDIGSFGVLLFFALSGCTLYISLSQREFKRSGFLIRRFFRIWPLFTFSIVVYVFFSISMSQYTETAVNLWITNQLSYSLSMQDLVYYLLLINNYFGQYQIINGAYWSLPVEFQFYLMFSIIYPVIYRTPLWISIIFTISIVVLSYVLYLYLNTRTSYNDYVFFKSIFSFLGGIIVAKVYLRKAYRYNLLFVFLAISSILFLAVFIRYTPLITTLHIEAWVLLSLLLLWIVLNMNTSKLINLKLLKVLEMFGTVSYSMYLFHNLLIMGTFLIFESLIDFQAWAAQILYAIFIMAAAYFISKIIYEQLEVKIINFGRKYEK